MADTAAACSGDVMSTGPLMSRTSMNGARLSGGERRRVSASELSAWLHLPAQVVASTVTLQNLLVEGALEIADLVIKGDLVFDDVVFAEDLKLHAVAVRSFALQNAVLRRGLHIDGLHIEKSQMIRNSTVCADASATHLEIGADLRIETSQLCASCTNVSAANRDDKPSNASAANRDEKASSHGFELSTSTVGGDLLLADVNAKSGIRIRTTHVGQRTRIEGGTLEGKGAEPALALGSVESNSGLLLKAVSVAGVSLHATRGSVYFLANTRIAGPTTLMDVVSGSLKAEGVVFAGPLRVTTSSLSSTEFIATRFSGDVFLMLDAAKGGFSCEECSVEGGFKLFGSSSQTMVGFYRTRFLCKDDCQCDPAGKDCKAIALFNVAGTVEFYGSDLRRSLIVTQSAVNAISISETKVWAPLQLDGIRAASAVGFSDTEIHASLALTDVRAPQLGFDGVTWDPAYKQPRWNQVEFDRLDLGKGDANFARAFELVEHIGFSPQFHKATAHFLEGEGRADLSQKILLQSARAALREGPQEAGGYLRFAWKWFLYGSIGSGVAPERAFLFLLLMLAGGTLYYRRADQMLWRGRGDSPRFSSFWYTVDLLLPIVKLEDAKDWWPRPELRGGLALSRVLRVLGFLMIPLLIAAVSGILK
jgi:hypothetical protein